MNSAALGKPDIFRREVAIINFLRAQPDGVTAREIYDAVSASIGDTISRPAYYKILDRLTAAGKIDEIADGDGTKRYMIQPHLHATYRLTLDDIYQMLPFLESTESMARAIEAQDYFVRHRDTVIRQAAEALLHEPAANLFFVWIDDLIKMVEADLRSFTLREEEGPHFGEAVLADVGLETRLRSETETLREVLYRHLSIPHSAVLIPEWDGPKGLKRVGRIHYDRDELRRWLQYRVFGIGEDETFLGWVSIEENVQVEAFQEMIVSGSDGSLHAGTLGLRTAQGYIEDESFVVTFNNSVAYIRSSERLVRARGEKKFLYSAPVTRETLDDPTYKGMVLAPFMYPMLTDSEYEHMARAASDVVQMRVDDAVFNGTARDIGTGEQIVPPRVHIRDGTITPQERGFNHYTLMNPYGDIAREGIARSRSILQRIMTAKRPQVYAGAVKSTQIRLFSRLISWYIARGSCLTRGRAIEPNWDMTRAGYISDIDVMTVLMASLVESRAERGGFWLSCVVLRQFASLTDFYDHRVPDGQSWFTVLRRYRQNELDRYEEHRGELPYHALLSEDDLAEDAYVYLLDHADYASFYIGHTKGQPAPKIPRYEFMCSLRGANLDQAKASVHYAIDQIVTALLISGFEQDREHNFMSKVRLSRLVPAVVYQAHEIAKTIGKKLETDYKSAVVARLAARRRQPIDERDAEIRPIRVLDYLRRYSNARQALPPPDRDLDER